MNNTILQVPLDKGLKNSAAVVASEYGFSSLQEVVRVMLSKFAQKKLTVSITEDKPEKLSPQAEKRYTKMIEDIKKGKNVTKTKNLDELFQLLNLK